MDAAYSHLAQAYDALMYDVDYVKWSEYLISLLKKARVKEGDSILDAACGTGSISLLLQQAGYRVTASDISESMLNAAAQKFQKAGEDIPLIRQDMRAITLHKKVEAVICACDGVNYLLNDEDILSFFRSAHSNLKQGGMLLFDVSSEYKLKEELGNGVFCDETEDTAYIWKNTFCSGLAHMELTLFVKQGEMFKRYTENHVQKAHSQETLHDLLYKAGFMEINSYGFLTGKAPGKKTARIQYSAKK